MPPRTAYLTRIVEFTATHRFPDTPEFSGATDDHSHRYKCAVTVKGVFDPAKSGVMSLQTLKRDRKSTRLNSSHSSISYAVFCLKKKKKNILLKLILTVCFESPVSPDSYGLPFQSAQHSVPIHLLNTDPLLL